MDLTGKKYYFNEKTEKIDVKNQVIPKADLYKDLQKLLHLSEEKEKAFFIICGTLKQIERSIILRNGNKVLPFAVPESINRTIHQLTSLQGNEIGYSRLRRRGFAGNINNREYACYIWEISKQKDWLKGNINIF